MRYYLIIKLFLLMLFLSPLTLLCEPSVIQELILTLFYTLSLTNNRFSFFPMPPRFSSIDAINVRQSPSGAGSVDGEEDGIFANMGFSAGIVSRCL